MAIKQGILTILSLGEAHGYQIRAELTSRAGQAWELNLGQVYQTLSRLERDGLIEQSQRDGSRQMYRITEEGLVQNKEWLNSGTIRSIEDRDELILKFCLAVTIPGVNVTKLLDAQRNANLHTLQILTKAKSDIDENDPKELSWVLALDNQIFSIESELRWLEHVRDYLEKAANRGISPKVGISSEVPYPGRPAKAGRGGR